MLRSSPDEHDRLFVSPVFTRARTRARMKAFPESPSVRQSVTRWLQVRETWDVRVLKPSSSPSAIGRDAWWRPSS